MAPKLADLGLKGLESPLPPNRIRDYQTLKRQGALPILMDEGIVSPVEVAEFIALEMFDGIAMKVARCGGLWNASRIVTPAAGKRIAAVRLRADRSRSVDGGFRAFLCLGRPDRPAALNGPQYLVDRGTTDPAFRAGGDMIARSDRAGPGHNARRTRGKIDDAWPRLEIDLTVVTPLRTLIRVPRDRPDARLRQDDGSGE